ncbi:MAG TPA: ParB/RepB/Spo0J family partition protein [Candidatus Omnitrophota bacterium]|nr:ParB/RepB/Spo0J family partition protein [Candidatus Omnitrophota bacterium]
MERKALGKGISALIPEPEKDRGEKIALIPTEQITANPLQPREDFSSEELDDLVSSIREKGILQPVLVRRKGDAFELIAGERRLRAAKMLSLQEVPVIIKDVDDRDSLELALIENVQRQNLNVIEEARAFQYLIEKFNLTQEEVSQVIGKSRESVANMLRLLKLPTEVLDEIRGGRMSFGHGRALLELQDENQQRRLAQTTISKSLSVRELENLVKHSRPRSRRLAITAAGLDPFVSLLEAELQQILATKVRIIKRKKRGRIVIDFYSQEDMERIIGKMRGETKHESGSAHSD